MINWKLKSKKDSRLIRQIAKRTHELAVKHGIDYPYSDIEMDLTAAHLNGCKLDLQKLHDADDANFGHDVFGIRRFIDRKTGKIPDEQFWPRCGAPDEEEVAAL